MKRLSRMLGVTLLEIMLVLAIAAMIIVMSIRYYQNATVAQQSNGVMQTVLAITAAGDNLAMGAGTYSAATDSSVKNMIGSTNYRTPWSGTSNGYTISGGAGTSYVVKISPLPAAVCSSIAAKLALGKSGSHFTGSGSGCTAAGAASSVAYTYNANALP